MNGFKINYIFSKDMRLGKYTSEHRNLGQAEGAHKVGASERSSQNPAARISDRNACVSRRARSVYGVPENACVLGCSSPIT